MLAACLAFGQNAAKPTELQRAIEEFKIQSRDMGLREDSPSVTQHNNGTRKWRWHGRLFENFRSDILDAVLTRLARGARIVICGAISQYNNTTPIKGPANYLALLVQRATMTGIVVSDYYDRAGEAAMVMAGWIQSGKLKTREDVVDGLDAFPQAFDMLFSGANNGKLVLKVGA